MKLHDWIRQEKTTCEDLAARVGCDTTTISRLIPRAGKKQTRRPSFDLAKAITDATGGAVTANDFMEDASPEAHSQEVTR